MQITRNGLGTAPGPSDRHGAAAPAVDNTGGGS